MIVRAPAPHTAPAASLQRQSAAAPVWTIQQVAPAPVEAQAQRLVAGDRLAASELDVGGERGRRASRRRASISAVNDGAAVAATIAVIATTTASSSSVSPRCRRLPVSRAAWVVAMRAL